MLYTLDALLQWTPRMGQWICKPLIQHRGTVLIGAEPKLGKSLVAMNVGYALSNGDKVFDIWPTRSPQRVLYFDQELGMYGAQERMRSIHIVKQGEYAGLNFNVVSKDLKLKLDTPEGRGRIKSWIKQANPNVVIFDPLVSMHNQDENDNSAMHKVMEEIFKLEEEHDIAVILVHHFNKADPKYPTPNPNRSRGASTVWGDVDTFISLGQQLVDEKKVINVNYSLRFDKSPKQTKLTLGDDYVLRLREG